MIMPRVLADLHIHSRFSFATAKSLDPESLDRWGALKGLGLIGTGDMTHPGWLSELSEKLFMGDDGFYGLKDSFKGSLKGSLNGPRFVPTGEVSCVYKHLGRARRIHLWLMAPDLEAAGRLARSLGRLANVESDGRPILSISARDALEMALEADERAEVIPAHVWTPWYSVFGSKAGYDDIEECFGDLSPHIRALETGLSSDPGMIRLVSKLDRYALVSFSDAHSPENLGREATAIEGPLDFSKLKSALRGGPELIGTVEFFPEEGKYHLDGHVKCGPAMTPSQTKESKGLCPVCGKPVTLGVLSRVHQLADREEPLKEAMLPDWHIVPLDEILSQAMGQGPATKGVQAVYRKLVETLGGELEILLDAPLEAIKEAGGPLLARGVERMRAGEVELSGGFDGAYGKASVITEEDKKELIGAVPESRVKRRSKPKDGAPA